MGKPKSNTAEFIRRATIIHNGKYDYSKVNYINQHEPVLISCPIHGEWSHKPRRHLQYGCNKCAQEIRVKDIRKTHDQVLEQAMAVHGDKYDYTLVKYENNVKSQEH